MSLNLVRTGQPRHLHRELIRFQGLRQRVKASGLQSSEPLVGVVVESDQETALGAELSEQEPGALHVEIEQDQRRRGSPCPEDRLRGRGGLDRRDSPALQSTDDLSRSIRFWAHHQNHPRGGERSYPLPVS